MESNPDTKHPEVIREYETTRTHDIRDQSIPINSPSSILGLQRTPQQMGTPPQSRAQGQPQIQSRPVLRPPLQAQQTSAQPVGQPQVTQQYHRQIQANPQSTRLPHQLLHQGLSLQLRPQALSNGRGQSIDGNRLVSNMELFQQLIRNQQQNQQPQQQPA
ncbi:8864_t:CDS:2 [Paraglomus brasilianum]|uniref:8864_t:CDS:1 n=1 Tax=Paraglomus brasilianum TaxID=144538 RepID=A0A9N9G2N5_9GLOM|nr:8864_t:CDS:2 [Paraglomus brasilianum]